MLVPVGKSSGIFPASLGLVKALENKGVKAVLFRPIEKCSNVCAGSYAVAKCKAKKMIADNLKSELLELIVANFNRLVNDTDAKFVVIEGAIVDGLAQHELNANIAHAFDARLLTVSQGSCHKNLNAIKIALKYFGQAGIKRVLGNIVLNPDAPKDGHGHKILALAGCGGESCGYKTCNSTSKSCHTTSNAIENTVATIGFDMKNYGLRACDIANFIKGSKLTGDANARVYMASFDAQAANDNHVLVTDKVVDTNARVIILASGTENTYKDRTVIETFNNIWQVVALLTEISPDLSSDDTERKDYAMAQGAKAFGDDILNKILEIDATRTPLMSPAAFRYKLTELARAAHKRIALPEGDEPRTVCAASKVASMGIATPVLFGNKEKILQVAKEQGVTLSDGVEFIDPEEVRTNYVDRLVELRKKKGMTQEQALEMLQDNVALATMLIERNEVDGLVSGAVHTTANTIRPPLQIIKTAPGASLVSSVFFMLMPEQVYVFGDCAINPNPKPEEIAEIAIQSADTAKTFGIDPRIAMVTYSTVNSGKGPDIDTVIEATRIAKEKRPDLCIDGPLQYDAAVMEDVAAQKAPNSKVAGKATVFIFPSLEVGNVVYKAVQRSADLVSIGPMLQGMRKPVNDLSRGALVDDIIYTIAITAIQATQQ